MEEFRDPYLEAIQAIPGNQPDKKFKWIFNVVKDHVRALDDVAKLVESKKIRKEMWPLVRLEAAKLLKNHEIVTECLKSEDSVIVNRALSVSWFFDGSNKSVLNAEYFAENIFSNVSLKTRRQIVKTLARRLFKKDPSMAEEFFLLLFDTYGTEESLPLLAACSDSFFCETVVRKNIFLPPGNVKQLLRVKPQLAVRYLKLSLPKKGATRRDIYKYDDYFGRLVKKHLKDFTEIFEALEPNPPNVKLSKTATRILVKNARERIIAKPKLYFKVLPLELIDQKLLETIFPQLMPDNIASYSTDSMLDRLKHYPQDERASFLVRTYEKVYGTNFYSDQKNVTAKLLEILEAAERAKQARMKMQCCKDDNKFTDAWRCYLPIEESIPTIKGDIATCTILEHRAIYLKQMFQTCKVNKDDKALLETLQYYNDRHKNEQPLFHTLVLEELWSKYDLPNFSEKHWNVFHKIFQRCYVKGDLKRCDWLTVKILEDFIHYQLKNNLAIEETIDTLIKVKCRMWGNWNFIQDQPQYERKCLEACIFQVMQKFEAKDKLLQEYDKTKIIMELVKSIYCYNERHCKPPSRNERLSILNYPRLMEYAKDVFVSKDTTCLHHQQCLKEILTENERDLYNVWIAKFSDENIKNTEITSAVRTGEALRHLKNDASKVLENMEIYVKSCRDFWYDKKVKRFVKRLRWYNDVPLMFVQLCVQKVQTDYDTISLRLLAVLLHGESFVRLVEPLLPTESCVETESDDARQKYHLVKEILRGMCEANPPAPLKLVERLCNGDYLSVALFALTNICRRTSLPKVQPFVRSLLETRVSIRKHGIRLLCQVESLKEVVNFLLSQTKLELHCSIRLIVFDRIFQLFFKEPREITWNGIVASFGDLTANDTDIFKYFERTKEVPTEYLVDYVKLTFKTIENLGKKDLSQTTVARLIIDILSNMEEETCDLLPDSFMGEVFEKYLFHPYAIDRTLVNFLFSRYIFCNEERINLRLAIFFSIFAEKVLTEWNKAHPEKWHVCYANCVVSMLVKEFACEALKQNCKIDIIDGMLKTFNSVLAPTKDPESYVQLTLARLYAEFPNAQSFGRELASKLPQLVDVFTAAFIPYLGAIFKDFILTVVNEEYDRCDDTVLTVSEGLLKSGSTHAFIIVATFLESVNPVKNEMAYKSVVEKLSKCDDPAVTAIICRMISKRTE